VDESALLKLNDHAMNAGWGNDEEAFEVGLGRRPTIHEGVEVDEGQVLPLLVSELGLG
jgi:hypothetical protein